MSGRRGPAGAGTILFVCNSLNYFEAHRLPPVRQALAQGFKAHIAAGADAEPDQVAAMGVPFHALPMVRERASPSSDRATAARIRALVEEHRPDLVHAITLKANLLTLLALRDLPDLPLVTTFPGLGRVFTERHGAWTRMRRIIVEGILRHHYGRRPRTAATFENATDRGLLVSRGLLAPGRAHVVRGTGFDLASVAGLNLGAEHRTGPVTVLFAGRLLRDKGVFRLREAAARYHGEAAAHDLPKVRFLIAGAPDPGNVNSLSADQMAALERDPAVDMLGFVADMPGLLAQADLVCHPTRYGEGLPRILIEAAAAGLPAVASDLPGCKEIVIDDKTGRLFPADDDDALFQALRDLITDADRRRAYGAAARRHVTEGGFDEDSVARAFMAIYRSVQAPVGDR